MISIGNVVSVRDGVRYFDEAVAHAHADYYAARGEAPGVWRGEAARSLGLAGQVQRQQLVQVLEGRDPRTGEELGRHWTFQKNVAYDVTFSVPKSVSLLYALGEPDVKRKVLHALEVGAATSHGYLQRQAAWGRLSNPTTKAIEYMPAQLVTAAFVHRTARPVTRGGITTIDPQLHVHLLVAARARRANGTWGALYNEPLYAHAAVAGALGQAATRDVLVRDLGVRVRTNPNGTFEVEGFTVEQLAEFSQRHRQALAAAAAAGATSLYGQKFAVLDTRQSKSEIEPGSDLFAQWSERAAAVGLTHADIAALLDQEQVRELRWFDVDTVQDVVGRNEHGLTSRASVFTRRDLLRSLASHAPLGMQADQIEKLADSILADATVVTRMLPPQDKGESPTEAMRRLVERGMELHYSTPEVVALERRMLTSALARRSEATAVLAPAVVDDALRNRPTQLTKGQGAMVKAVCTSADGVIVVEGAAGTGKTTAANIIRQAYVSQGIPVIGCALSGRAAVGLQDEAGIPSFTIASLLTRLRLGEHLARGGVVIADECSMLGPDLAELVLRAEQDGAKLVLIGDSQQLQPVDGGALFKSLGDKLGRVELTEIVRQRERWDREALMALREGHAAPLVRRYLEEGRVHASADEASRVAIMAADWVAAAQSGHDVIAVARERAAVQALNAVTREAAVAAGLVAARGVRRQCVDLAGHKAVSLGELDFASGDQVLLVGRNRRRAGLIKGLRGTVVETGKDGTLILETSAASQSVRITVPTNYQGINHGYAMTAHRAQGATADIALVHGPDAADRQWQYVALSRHRTRATYYDVKPPVRDVDGVHHGQRPIETSTADRLIAVMSRDCSKASTLDYPDAYARQRVASSAAGGPEGGIRAEPTEAQFAILHDNGMVKDLPPAATWVHASLLIDEIFRTPPGVQAREWLVESGALPEEAEHAVEVARRELVASKGTSAIYKPSPTPVTVASRALKVVAGLPTETAQESSIAISGRGTAEQMRRAHRERSSGLSH